MMTAGGTSVSADARQHPANQTYGKDVGRVGSQRRETVEEGRQIVDVAVHQGIAR